MYIVKEMRGGKHLCMVYHRIYLDKYISCKKICSTFIPNFMRDYAKTKQ